MSKVVSKYGLLSGVVLAALLALTVPFEHQTSARWGMVVATIMVLSFLIVFVGVKHFRDVDCGGRIGFGQAFGAGMLMMLISSLCYVAMWEILVATVEKDFAHQYALSMEKHAQNSGLQGAALDAKMAEIRRFEAAYSNPIYRMGMTLIEPLPVGIVMALVTAGVLRRRPDEKAPDGASAKPCNLLVGGKLSR